jgi:hypothetical protein
MALPSLPSYVLSQPNRSSRLSGSGAVLGSVPDAQNRHHVRGGDPVDDEVGRHDHQLSRSSLTSRVTAMGEHHQTVAGQ